MLQLVLAVVLTAVAAKPGAVELNLLDGTTVAGPVTVWDARGVTVDAPEGHRRVAAAELLALRAASPPDDAPAPSMMLELIDGTRIPMSDFASANRVAKVKTPLATRLLSIPTARINRVELTPSTDAAAAMWRQLDDRGLAGDALLVIKREGALDSLSGVVGDVTADEVAFDWDGQKMPIKRTKVAGLAYYHAEPPRLPQPACLLTLSGGATIPVRQIMLDQDLLRIVTPAGMKLEVKLESLEIADFSAGKLAYLSDLKPASAKWTPRVAVPAAAELIAAYGAPRNNVSFSGSPLSLAWPDESLATGSDVRVYAKGLAIRSRTELAYRLPPGMKRFTAFAGIDPATTDQGHVVLEIRADDRVVWEGEIDGRQAPVEINVELKAARRLQFLVDYGRNLDYGDRLHLVEARVTQ